jgi:hypothetical protein
VPHSNVAVSKATINISSLENRKGGIPDIANDDIKR